MGPKNRNANMMVRIKYIHLEVSSFSVVCEEIGYSVSKIFCSRENLVGQLNIVNFLKVFFIFVDMKSYYDSSRFCEKVIRVLVFSDN